MNIVLSVSLEEFFICSVLRINEKYYAVSRRVNIRGTLLSHSSRECLNEKDAESKIKTLANIKEKKRNWKIISVGSLPNSCVKFLIPEPKNQIPYDEIVPKIKEAKQERYVTMDDNSGFEEYFDVGIEYLAFCTSNNCTLNVIDKFGNLRNCFFNRLKNIRLTERAEECVKLGLLNEQDFQKYR